MHQPHESTKKRKLCTLRVILIVKPITIFIIVHFPVSVLMTVIPQSR